MHIAQTPLFAAVERKVMDSAAFLVAKPLKAIVDYVVSRGKDWTDSEPLEDSLRIEAESLCGLTPADFDELEGVYKSNRARRFLSGLRKELGK